MKKFLIDFTVVEAKMLSTTYLLLKLTPNNSERLPEMFPGQFVEVRVDDSSTTYLRRPISIHYVDYATNQLWLLIQVIGDGTARMSRLKKGDMLNLLLPLGNGYGWSPSLKKPLLVGGGVGTAPLLYLGTKMKEQGVKPVFLLGARTATDLVQLDQFGQCGEVFVTTEDGSFGEKGYVTNHSVLHKIEFDGVFTCGPKPMMQAVACYARQKSIFCQVSLENTMACGFGVCLCCVENTTQGHLCVCKEGPVFNIEKLLW